jgi:glutathione S-transferase
VQAWRYPQFVEASPRGLVPALVHDGVCVNDSMVCCEYLADISPPGVLLPTPAASRAHVRSLRFREERANLTGGGNALAFKPPPMRRGCRDNTC